MPWVIKTLLVLAKSRRGRKLLFATALTVVELVQHEQAQKLYAKARTRIHR